MSITSKRMFGWKWELLTPIKVAVYSAAAGLTDEEIREAVEESLRRARRDLSS